MKRVVDHLLKSLSLTLLLTCVTMASLHAEWAREENVITVDGSSSGVLLARAIGYDLYKQQKAKVAVMETNSEHGILSLIYGTADIAALSRPIHQHEIEEAERNNLTLKENVAAIDCLIMIVHPDNPVENLTLEQIRDIYTGKITNWKQVKGLKKPIRVLHREQDSGTEEAFVTMVMQGKKISSDAKRIPGNRNLRAAVAADSGAIGFIGHGFVNGTVSELRINGIMHDSSNRLAHKAYPLQRKLYFYSKATPSEAEKLFLEYPKTPAGKKLIHDIGMFNNY